MSNGNDYGMGALVTLAIIGLVVGIPATLYGIGWVLYQFVRVFGRGMGWWP